MKTILVTGGAGFVGTHLCKRLHEAGHRVISLDNYFAGSRENHVEGVEYREGHTKDIELYMNESIDCIFHLGEYSRVEQSVLEPQVVYDLNVLGTQGVIDFWRKHKCKLVYAGSSTKFGDDGKTRETSPYASSKAANTELVKAAGDREGLSYAITYFYNVYGPGERAGVYGTFIEACKQMYLNGSPITVVAPGTQERNFTHVDDIVDGLILVGESGSGDEYGLGNSRGFSILEVAQMFGGEVVMLPARASNRMRSGLDTSKTNALGWRASRSLETYIGDFLAHHSRGVMHEKRVLVFSTTLYPVEGPAERALTALMRIMPSVQFDVITSRFSKAVEGATDTPSNVHVYRVGYGYSMDKYLLPFLGYRKARELARSHTYLFAWSIMASYAALAALRVKRATKLPLLITLADQNVHNTSFFIRFMLKYILTGADLVYGIDNAQEEHAARILSKKNPRTSIGEGDAFANQVRYVYAATFLDSERSGR